MTLEYHEYEEYNTYDTLPSRPRRRWLEMLLLTGFIFCLLIGLAALFVLLSHYRTTRLTLNDNPLTAIQTKAIVPQLALMQLAGDPANPLAFQAMNAGELETSRAILTYGIQSGEPGRLELLLKLAQAYGDHHQLAAAAQLYRLVQAVAILDNAPGSFARSQTLIKASEGFFHADEHKAALDSAIQAKRLAEQAPDLLPAQRSQLFLQLRPLASQLENTTLSNQLAELVRNPFLKTSGAITATTWLTLATPLTFDPNLTTAMDTRQQRARELAQRILLTNGRDIDPERQALMLALVEEDRLRHEYSSRVPNASLSLSQQFWLFQAERDWLILKIRIAQGGFGLSLVPGWETNLDALQQELFVTTNRLMDVLNAFANAQAMPVDQALWRVEALRWLALQTEFGLYPSTSPAEISDRLRSVQTTLTQLGNATPFPLAYAADATPPGFRIQSRQQP